jgi:hypothetical protein
MSAVGKHARSVRLGRSSSWLCLNGATWLHTTFFTPFVASQIAEGANTNIGLVLVPIIQGGQAFGWPQGLLASLDAVTPDTSFALTVEEIRGRVARIERHLKLHEEDADVRSEQAQAGANLARLLADAPQFLSTTHSCSASLRTARALGFVTLIQSRVRPET